MENIKYVNLSVILPSYQESDNLVVILPKIKEELSKLGINYEIIVVDTMQAMDETEKICEKNNVIYINRINGNSYGDAIRTGIEKAIGKSVIFMDADGSHSPAFIRELYEHRNEADVIIASRYIDGGDTENSKILILMSLIVNILYSLVLNLKCKDVSNSFKLYKGEQLKNLVLGCNNFDIVEEILFKLKKKNKNIKFLELPYTFKKRIFGKTKRNLWTFAFFYLYTLLKLRFTNLKIFSSMQDKDIGIKLPKLHKILKKSLKFLCLLYAIVITFAVANFPVMKFAYFFHISRDSAVLLRGFIFFIALIILFYFAFKNIRSLRGFLSWGTFFRSILVFIFLSILVSTLKVTYMGEVYANISLSPFDQDVGFFYRRILEPAVAYYLQLKGEVLYGLLHFFITFSCIYLIIIWLEKKLLVKLRIWQLVSIMTAGIIIHQFQAPGYPEVLILLMALLSLFIPLDKYGRISILALMFLTHESAALFLGLVFSWFYFPKEERKYYVLLPFLFYFLWLVNYGFSFVDLFLGHLTLTDGNALSLFLRDIKMVGLPVFFAYKFLWFFVIFSLYDYLKRKEYKPLIRIATIVMVPLALVVIPDTSRVIAWGSIGVFLAIAHSYKYLRRGMFNLILVVNLVLPSVAVGISSGGPVSYVGLYGFIIDLFKLFVKNYLM